MLWQCLRAIIKNVNRQKQVDNSNLAQEVPNKISATDKSIIEQYQVNKSVGDEVENKVRKEQNEGL